MSAQTALAPAARSPQDARPMPARRREDLREEIAQVARRDPRRDSVQMTGPAAVLLELRQELVALKKRVKELEADLAAERVRRTDAEDALHAMRQSVSAKASATRSTKELRAPVRRGSQGDRKR